MNLVAYSDSEDEADDAPPPFPPAAKSAAKPAPRPAFQKVVDRANPGKIKLNLPGAAQPLPEQSDVDAQAPPAKKPRLGGGAFGGFNAMLPAPTKLKPKLEATTADAPSARRGLGKRLGAGVNLKTGAEPAFKREPRTDLDAYDENGGPIKREERKQDDFRALLNLPAPKSKNAIEEVPQDEFTKMGATPEPAAQAPVTPRFMPKGMGWGKKKKPSAVQPAAALSSENKAGPVSRSMPANIEQKPASKPKVSLFGVSQAVHAPAKQSSGDYQPLLYGAREDDEEPSIPDSAFEARHHAAPQSFVHPTPPASLDLTNIASELNLSGAERRQLLGRKGQGLDLTSAKIVDFNTDAEYAHNEMLRQQGETVQHNALKSISGTGKNSLRSLINVASTQKDALEEHFASGRRNKKEAGNKYGW